MNFKEKLRGAFYKVKTRLLVGAILMLVILIAGGAPLSIALADNNKQKTGEELITTDVLGEIFWEDLGEYVSKPISALKLCFTPDYFPTFYNAIKVITLIYLSFGLIGLIKAFPKHEFSDIEHGSSKWAQNGEQYAVLSKNKGIILAEKNYLPVDKRGNVNVLVVRRLWSW